MDGTRALPGKAPNILGLTCYSSIARAAGCTEKLKHGIIQRQACGVTEVAFYSRAAICTPVTQMNAYRTVFLKDLSRRRET